jgi:putative endonuclease
MRYGSLFQREVFLAERDVGATSDLMRRLTDHNAGRSPRPSKYAPWKFVTYKGREFRALSEIRFPAMRW